MTEASTAIVPTIDLAFLANEVNDAHRHLAFHSKSMLSEARRAGEALIEVKKRLRHGEFKPWVAANCRCSYRQAAKYMAVAKCASLGTFEGGIDAFLKVQSKALYAEHGPATLTFTAADAEHALKLSRLACSGNANEASVAQTKLERFAQQFGMTAAEAKSEADFMRPLDHMTAAEAARQGEAAVNCSGLKVELLRPFVGLNKNQLLDVIFEMLVEQSERSDF
ncbi:MAG TPA: DUF3102 domain-containing protein [Kaistia sp.]|nr:DUF3102 domain-containing protein [Kaistia sp.]